MLRDLERVLFTQEQLQMRVAQLRQQLAHDFAGKDPIFLGVLKGSIPFFADMTTTMPIPCCYDFVSLSSYGGTTQSTGSVLLTKDVSLPLRGRHVVVLEDILDTGHTLHFLKHHLLRMEPASLSLCVLLDKPDRRRVALQADYVGFTIPDLFVVGYGLDYHEHYRNLPCIGVLKSEIYSN